MIRAPTGVMWKLEGSSKDMAAGGPKPGNTPTKVPIKQPVNARKRFAGCRHTWKPRAREFKKSKFGSLFCYRRSFLHRRIP